MARSASATPSTTRLGELRPDRRRRLLRPHQRRHCAGRDAAVELADRLVPPLPDRLEPRRHAVLCRRHSPSRPTGRFRADAADRQRRRGGRPGRLGRLAAPQPLSGERRFTSRVFDAGEAANWGTLSLEQRPPGRNQPRAQGAPRRDPDPGRLMERVPDRGRLRGGDRRELALPPVPSRARDEQPRRDPGSARRDSHLRDRSRHGRTRDPRALARARTRPVWHAPQTDPVGFNEPMDAGLLHAARTSACGRRASAADVPATISVAGANVSLDPGADLQASTDLRGHRLRQRHRRGGQRARLGRHLDVHHGRAAGADDHRHERGRLRRRHARCLLGLDPRRRRRAHVDAGWCSRAFPGRRCRPAGRSRVRTSGGTATVAGGQLVVSAARAGTSTSSDAAKTLEFVATFGAGAVPARRPGRRPRPQLVRHLQHLQHDAAPSTRGAAA